MIFEKNIVDEGQFDKLLKAKVTEFVELNVVPFKKKYLLIAERQDPTGFVAEVLESNKTKNDYIPPRFIPVGEELLNLFFTEEAKIPTFYDVFFSFEEQQIRFENTTQNELGTTVPSEDDFFTVLESFGDLNRNLRSFGLWKSIEFRNIALYLLDEVDDEQLKENIFEGLKKEISANIAEELKYTSFWNFLLTGSLKLLETADSGLDSYDWSEFISTFKRVKERLDISKYQLSEDNKKQFLQLVKNKIQETRKTNISDGSTLYILEFLKLLELEIDKKSKKKIAERTLSTATFFPNEQIISYLHKEGFLDIDKLLKVVEKKLQQYPTANLEQVLFLTKEEAKDVFNLKVKFEQYPIPLLAYVSVMNQEQLKKVEDLFGVTFTTKSVALESIPVKKHKRFTLSEFDEVVEAIQSGTVLDKVALDEYLTYNFSLKDFVEFTKRLQLTKYKYSDDVYEQVLKVCETSPFEKGKVISLN
jgi:hypothetical protein